MDSRLRKSGTRRLLVIAAGSLALAAASALPASPETGWVSLGLDIDFHELAGVVADPVTANVAYAALLVFDAPCGVARSEDWGLFWRPACNGMPEGAKIVKLVFAPSGNLFALGLSQLPQDPPNSMRPGLWESRDGAMSWAPVGLPPSFRISCPGCSGQPHPALAFDAADSESFFVAGEGGLFRTRDHGATWERLASSLLYYDALSVAVDPLSPRRIYLGLQGAHQGDGLYLSNDDGRSWARVERGGPRSIVISPGDPAVVWSVHTGTVEESRDRGAHWSDVLYTGAYGLTTTLLADALDGQTAYFGSEVARGLRLSRLVKTGDGGRHWFPLTQGLPPNLIVEGITQSPRHPEQLLVADLARVFCSQDGGITWSSGGYGFGETAVIALAAAPDGALLAIANNVLLRFDRGLHDWESAGGAIFQPPFLPAEALTLDPRDPRTIYAGAIDPVDGVLFKSTDGGVTWDDLDFPIASPVADLVVDPHDSTTLVAAAPGSPASPGGGVFKSTDAGATWTPLGGIMGAGELALDPTTDPATLYVANGSLLKSVDGGATWITLPVSDHGEEVHRLTHLALAPSAPQVLYALSEEAGGSVFRSRDGGGTWKRVGGPLSAGASPPSVSHHPLAVDTADPAVLYVGWVKGVARSVGGAPWTFLDDRLPPSPVVTLALSGRQLLVGTIDAGAFTLSLDAPPSLRTPRP
jgi:photosystem II stability/assembly factor-like uncharacterized protein